MVMIDRGFDNHLPPLLIYAKRKLMMHFNIIQIPDFRSLVCLDNTINVTLFCSKIYLREANTMRVINLLPNQCLCIQNTHWGGLSVYIRLCFQAAVNNEACVMLTFPFKIK